MKLPSKNDEIIKGKTPKKKLTVKQQKFVEALANPKTKSATHAALEAGYSPKSARFIAYENSTKPYISEQAQERIERALKNAGTTLEEVIGSASFQMRGSIDDVLNEHGAFDLEKARTNGSIDLIKKMEITERPIFGTGEVERTYKVEMMGNEGGRKELADYLGVKQNPRENDFNLRLAAQTVALQYFADLVHKLQGRGEVQSIEIYTQEYIDTEPVETRAKLAEHKPRLLAGVQRIIDCVEINPS